MLSSSRWWGGLSEFDESLGADLDNEETSSDDHSLIDINSTVSGILAGVRSTTPAPPVTNNPLKQTKKTSTPNDRLKKHRAKKAEEKKLDKARMEFLLKDNLRAEASIRTSQALFDQLDAILGAHREAQPGHAAILEDCWRI